MNGNENASGGGYPPIIINQPPASAQPPAQPPAVPVIVTPGNQQGAGSQNTIPWWGFMGGYGGYGGYGGWGGYGRGYGGYGAHYFDQKREEADRVRDTCNLGSNLRNDFTEQNLNKAVTDAAATNAIGQASIGKAVGEAALNNALGQAELRGSIADNFARLSLAACQSNADLRQQLCNCCHDIEAKLAECCCDTQKEILRSNFENQKGFASIDRTLCEQGSLTRQNDNDNTQKILNAIAESTLTETRDKLADAQRQLSEARLPADILATFRNCGCCPPPPNCVQCCNGNGNGNGNGGSQNVNVEIYNMMNQFNRQLAELQGRMMAMQSDGRNGPPGPP